MLLLIGKKRLWKQAIANTTWGNRLFHFDSLDAQDFTLILEFGLSVLPFMCQRGCHS